MFQSTDLVEVHDPSSARLFYPQWSLVPLRITYPDNSRVEFTFDGKGRPATVKERNNVEWTRIGEPDSTRFAVWTSTDGQTLKLRYEVLPSGALQRQDSFGLTRIVLPSGKSYLAFPLPDGIDMDETIFNVYHESDTNKDKALNQIELQRAALSPWSCQKFELFVTILYLSFSEILNLRSDPMLIEAGGLEAGEIKTHHKRCADAISGLLHPGGNFKKTFSDLFVVADSDKDGMICLNDLPAFLKETTLAPSQKQLIELVVNFAFGREAFEPYGFTDRADWIYQEEFLKVSEAAVREATRNNVIESGWWIPEATVKNVWAGPPVYAQGENAAESVRAHGVHCGAVGNAMFMAALAGLAGINPPSVTRMIAENQTGVCTVTFPGAPGIPLTFEMPGLVEACLRTRSTKYGIWPAILEKAYTLLAANASNHASPALSITSVIHDSTNDQSVQKEFMEQLMSFSEATGITQSAFAAGGISTQPATQVEQKQPAVTAPAQSDPIYLLSGRAGAWHALTSFSHDSLSAKLQDNMRQRRIVICSSKEAKDVLSPSGERPQFWAISKFDKDSGKITMRNPARAGDAGSPQIAEEQVQLADLSKVCKSIYLG